MPANRHHVDGLLIEAVAFPMSLQRTLDLLHERSVLEDVHRLLLPLPILSADDDEVLASTPPDAQRNMVFHHSLHRLPQVTAELMNGYLFHGPDCTRNRYRMSCE